MSEASNVKRKTLDVRQACGNALSCAKCSPARDFFCLEEVIPPFFLCQKRSKKTLSSLFKELGKATTDKPITACCGASTAPPLGLLLAL